MGRGIIIGGGVIILFACIASLLLVNGILQSIGQHVITDPAQVEAIAVQIAHFERPTGYQPDYAVDYLGFSMAAYSRGDSHSHLMLLQAPPSVHINQDEMEQQLHLAEGEQYDRDSRLTTVRTERRMVHGQAATLVLSDGISSVGDRYRQCSLMFEGETGTVLLVFSEPVTRWSVDRMNALVASLG